MAADESHSGGDKLEQEQGQSISFSFEDDFYEVDYVNIGEYCKAFVQRDGVKWLFQLFLPQHFYDAV